MTSVELRSAHNFRLQRCSATDRGLEYPHSPCSYAYCSLRVPIIQTLQVKQVIVRAAPFHRRRRSVAAAVPWVPFWKVRTFTNGLSCTMT